MAYLTQTFKTIINCPFIDFTKLAELYSKGNTFNEYPFISSAIQENLQALNAAMKKDRAVYDFKYVRRINDERLVEIAKILNVYDELKTIDELDCAIEDVIYPSWEINGSEGLRFLASVATGLGNLIGIRN